MDFSPLKRSTAISETGAMADWPDASVFAMLQNAGAAKPKTRAQAPRKRSGAEGEMWAEKYSPGVAVSLPFPQRQPPPVQFGFTWLSWHASHCFAKSRVREIPSFRASAASVLVKIRCENYCLPVIADWVREVRYSTHVGCRRRQNLLFTRRRWKRSAGHCSSPFQPSEHLSYC